MRKAAPRMYARMPVNTSMLVPISCHIMLCYSCLLLPGYALSSSKRAGECNATRAKARNRSVVGWAPSTSPQQPSSGFPAFQRTAVYNTVHNELEKSWEMQRLDLISRVHHDARRRRAADSAGVRLCVCLLASINNKPRYCEYCAVGSLLARASRGVKEEQEVSAQ